MDALNLSKCATTFHYLKTITLNKGGRAHANPLWDAEVTQEVIYSGWTPFVSYVNTLANRSGVDKADISLKETWHKHCAEDTNYLTDKRTESKLYLPIQRSQAQGVIADEKYGKYYVNGYEATEAEIAIIKQWLPKTTHHTSSTQRDLGITNEQMFLALDITKITYIKQGAKVATL